VYDNETEDLEGLNKYLDNGTNICLDHYRLNQFNSVHIGTFVTEQESTVSTALVAVVMPVFN
jgi:hypothetical protein